MEMIRDIPKSVRVCVCVFVLGPLHSLISTAAGVSYCRFWLFRILEVISCGNREVQLYRQALNIGWFVAQGMLDSLMPSCNSGRSQTERCGTSSHSWGPEPTGPDVSDPS